MTIPRPLLDQINLVVRDMEASVRFYEQAGLEFEPTDADWAAHHRSAHMAGGIDLSLDSVAFAPVWNGGWGGAGNGSVVLGFALPSREAVDAMYASLTAAGARGTQPPFDAFWGARFAIVEDPDGNGVGFQSPSDPEWRTETPPAPGG
jgi:predicted lactoylglutathione lyase